MKKTLRRSTILLAFAFLSAPLLSTAQVQLPVVNGKEAVATVNGEPVTWETFHKAFAAVHATAQESGGMVHKQNPQELLNRLITVELAIQEAREMGLDQLPDLRRALEVFQKDTLKRMLFSRQTQGLKKAQPAHVDALYRKETQQYRITSILIEKENDARAFEAAVRRGGDFDALSKDWTKAGKAHQGDQGELIKDKDILPEIEKVISKMKAGTVSSPIKVGKGFAVVKVLETKTADDPIARAQAEDDALNEERIDALKKFTDDLVAQNVTLNQKMFDSLDFEAPSPGFAALRRDSRVLATIKGGEPLTVAYLAEALEKKFFHGIQEAIKKSRINSRKGEVLEEILLNRVAVLEARKQKLDQTAEFKERVTEHENELLFGAFIVKAIDPGVKVEDADLEKYFKTHSSEFTTPPMMVLDGLAFRKRADAEQALSRLRRGADFAWVRNNSEGIVDHRMDAAVMEWNPGAVPLVNLPEGVRKAVAGANSGDFRFYASPEGYSYVVFVKEMIPPKPAPFEAARDQIRQAVFNEKREAALADYAGKLRQAATIKTFATGDQLTQLIQKRLGPK